MRPVTSPRNAIARKENGANAPHWLSFACVVKASVFRC